MIVAERDRNIYIKRVSKRVWERKRVRDLETGLLSYQLNLGLSYICLVCFLIWMFDTKPAKNIKQQFYTKRNSQLNISCKILKYYLALICHYV